MHDGERIGAVITFKNITLRMRAEQTMRLRDRSLAAISQGLFITDPSRSDEPIIYVNKAFESMTGYTQGEVAGRDIGFLRGKHTDPAAIGEIRAAMLEGERVRGRAAARSQGRQAVLVRLDSLAGRGPRPGE